LVVLAACCLAHPAEEPTIQEEIPADEAISGRQFALGHRPYGFGYGYNRRPYGYGYGYRPYGYGNFGRPVFF
jgi:hypothetical protein